MMLRPLYSSFEVANILGIRLGTHEGIRYSASLYGGQNDGQEI